MRSVQRWASSIGLNDETHGGGWSAVALGKFARCFVSVMPVGNDQRGARCPAQQGATGLALWRNLPELNMRAIRCCCARHWLNHCNPCKRGAECVGISCAQQQDR